MVGWGRALGLANGVNLTLNEIASNCSFGPAFGHHGAQSEAWLWVGQHMHPKMGGVPHGLVLKRLLKLGPCFELDHGQFNIVKRLNVYGL